MVDVAFHDRALLLPDHETVVIADTHIGRSEASNVEFPLDALEDLETRLRNSLEALDPAEVVIAGDVLHQFDRVSVSAERGLDRLRAVCRQAGVALVFVRGNHDTILPNVWNGPLHDEYSVDDEVLVHHGHERPDPDAVASAELLVIGHDHPVISIEGRTRPCFLSGSGPNGDVDLLMLPAFTRLAAGAEVNGMAAVDFQSPLITDADALRPIVVDPEGEETLTFPPLGEFRRML